jgi:hypothetical protein
MEKFEGCPACKMEDEPKPPPATRVERSKPEPLVWESDGFEYTARGKTGTWSLLPYKTSIGQPQEEDRDTWIIRGRGNRAAWKYFGAFQQLESAQAYAARFDAQRVLWRDTSDREEDDER